MEAISRRRFIGTVGAGIATLALTGATTLPAAAAPAQGGLTSLPSPKLSTAFAGPTTWNVVVGAESNDMAVQGMGFFPSQIWINVGDTIKWTIQSKEIHTVTFMPKGQAQPPFNQNDPNQAQRRGGDHFNNTGTYFNSGILTKGSPNTTYSLTFDIPGDFTYICLVHTMMKAAVHVRPSGTPYPYDQHFYDMAAKLQADELIRHGQALIQQARLFASRNPNRGNWVTAGIGDGSVALMRFYDDRLVIREGDTVTFNNLDVETPHTVTFGPEPANSLSPVGNPKAYDGSGTLNSGFIGTDPHWFGTTFAVTFTKAGTYPYICALHDEMGMTGTIVVQSKKT